MILFVSGRTDILSYYPEWFIKRVEEGFIDTRNPFNDKLVSRIDFKMVDIIVFCSKNPKPFLRYLPRLEKALPNVEFIFQITITPYKEDIEPVIAKVKKDVIESVKYLSKRYGKDNILIRFDPIFKSEKYPLSYHLKAFSHLLDVLDGYINKVNISFIDLYKNVLKNNEKFLHIEQLEEKDYEFIGIEFSKVAQIHNVSLFTCGEKNDLVKYGFSKDSCLSFAQAKEILAKYGKGYVKLKKQTNRNNSYCDCVQMVDIGAYNSCLSFCRYCYANYDEKKVKENYANHNKNSSLLIGEIKEDDEIKYRNE